MDTFLVKILQFYFIFCIYLILNVDLTSKPQTYIVGEQNLGPCSGFKYHILSTMRPRKGNHRETS